MTAQACQELFASKHKIMLALYRGRAILQA